MKCKNLFSIAFFVAISLALTINIMAQETHKKVDEAKGLSVGDEAPDFNGVTQFDEEFQLSEALKNGPVVVIFYRGQWCPICNKHLAGLQEDFAKIYNRGANVVAVSPEKSEFLKQTAEKTGADFDLVYDEDYKIARAFDVLFKPDDASIKMYNTKLNANLEEAHSDDSQQLPIPATFIIDQNQKVVWRHFDPDYKKRASVADIVDHIPK